MIHFWLLYHILFLIVIITTTKNVGLRTQQGIIYGRQTQNSIEYLGLEIDYHSLINFIMIVP
jgi:hypothetical protein